MAEQLRKQPSKQEESTTEEVEAKDLKDKGLENDVDEILDEIDDVLETNAEEFVKSFVQKGGQ